jgi:hypothetical protein
MVFMWRQLERYSRALGEGCYLAHFFLRVFAAQQDRVLDAEPGNLSGTNLEAANIRYCYIIDQEQKYVNSIALAPAPYL